MKNKQVYFQDWGLMDYKKAWDRQEKLFSESVQQKLELRNKELALSDPGGEHSYDHCLAEETVNYLVLRTSPRIHFRQKRQS